MQPLDVKHLSTPTPTRLLIAKVPASGRCGGLVDGLLVVQDKTSGRRVWVPAAAMPHHRPPIGRLRKQDAALFEYKPKLRKD